MSGPDTPIGFAGLSAFRTNVDKALANADQVAAGPRPIRQAASNPASASTAQIQPVHRDGGAFKSGFKKVAGWAIGIGIIVAIKAGIWGGVHAVTSSPSPSADTTPTMTYSPDTTADNTPSAAQVGSNAASTNGWSIVDDNSSAPADTTQPVLNMPPPADPTAGDPTAMPKPSLGDTAVLTVGELRYCLAENIRVTAEQSELDGLRSDPDHYNRNVDTVNASITDFQSRCAHRSFQVSDRQIAEPQVETQRQALEAEGRNRVI